MKCAHLLLPLALLMTACSPSAPPETSTAAASPAPGAIASATGTIEAVDPAAGTVTIAHGAVEAFHWPPMTMTFHGGKVDLRSIKKGDRVSFRFTANGMNGALVSIQPTE